MQRDCVILTLVLNNSEPAVWNILLPTLTALLDNPPLEATSALHNLTIPHILSIATATPAVFRKALLALPIPVREKLEAAVRYSVTSLQQRQQEESELKLKRQLNAESNVTTATEPTIALKNFASMTQ